VLYTVVGVTYLPPLYLDVRKRTRQRKVVLEGSPVSEFWLCVSISHEVGGILGFFIVNGTAYSVYNGHRGR
jgi:hypothetical protein